MKLLLTLLAIIGLLSAIARADRSLTLAWDANPPDEQIAAYEVSIDGKLAATVYNTEAQLTIPDAKCALTVVAVNSLGIKSEPSNPLVIPVAPSNPKGVRVVKIIRTTISKP